MKRIIVALLASGVLLGACNAQQPPAGKTDKTAKASPVAPHAAMTGTAQS